MKCIALIILVSCSSIAQQTNDVIRVEFTSLTRGYQESIIITLDSIKFFKTQVGEPKINNARAFNMEEWVEINKILQKITLNEISSLESPTMKRTYDGAHHSTITLTTKNNQVYSHMFDNEEPHQKLVALMKFLKKKRENF